MKIKVKLFAMLADRLPPGSVDHTMELDVPEGATAHEVVHRLEIPPELATLTLIDGEHLTRDAFDHRALLPGDTLAIFPPIAGG